MKLFQYIVIFWGTIFVFALAYTGGEFLNEPVAIAPEQIYYAVDPNNPDGDPIKLSGEMEALDYDFPSQGESDYSKEAINKAIQSNLRGENSLVLGILYERLAYLEAQDNQYEAARAAYATALGHYSNDNQKLRVAELLSSMAHLEASIKNYASARDYYQKSSELFGRIGVPVRSDFAQKIAERLPVSD